MKKTVIVKRTEALEPDKLIFKFQLIVSLWVDYWICTNHDFLIWQNEGKQLPLFQGVIQILIHFPSNTYAAFIMDESWLLG